MPKSLSYFDDPQKIRHVQLELAAVVAFCKGNMQSWGDKLVALLCYTAVQEIVAFIEVGNALHLKPIVCQMLLWGLLQEVEF